MTWPQAFPSKKKERRGSEEWKCGGSATSSKFIGSAPADCARGYTGQFGSYQGESAGHGADKCVDGGAESYATASFDAVVDTKAATLLGKDMAVMLGRRRSYCLSTSSDHDA
jgi:hypothetical protein